MAWILIFSSKLCNFLVSAYINPIISMQNTFHFNKIHFSSVLNTCFCWFGLFIDFPNDDKVLNKPPNFQYHLQFAFTFLSNQFYNFHNKNPIYLQWLRDWICILKPNWSLLTVKIKTPPTTHPEHLRTCEVTSILDIKLTWTWPDTDFWSPDVANKI